MERKISFHTNNPTRYFYEKATGDRIAFYTIENDNDIRIYSYKHMPEGIDSLGGTVDKLWVDPVRTQEWLNKNLGPEEGSLIWEYLFKDLQKIAGQRARGVYTSRVY